MSRHVVEGDGIEVVVGWDPPLQSFFYQLFDLRRSRDEPELWSGAGPAHEPESGPMLDRLEEDARRAGIDLPDGYDRALIIRTLDEDRMVSR